MKDDVYPQPEVPLFPSSLIRKKHEIAGASARWMFSYKVDKVNAKIEQLIGKSVNLIQLMQGLVLQSSLFEVNYLVTKFRENRSDNGQSKDVLVGSLVSKRVMEKIVDVIGLPFIVAVTNNIEEFGRSFSSWIFRADFLFHLKNNSRQSTIEERCIRVHNTSGVVVPWKIGSYSEFRQDEDISKLPLNQQNCWLVPTKINKGCFDAFCISNNTLRIIQITVAAKHDFKMRYVVSVLKQLQAKLDNQITEVQLCVIIPQKRRIASDEEKKFQAGKFYAAPHVEWNNIVNKEIDERTSSLEKLKWKPENLQIFTFQRGQH